MFILAALIHLFSIGGIIQTTSLYPSAPSPVPGPGIIPWTGYLIPPVIPIPNINYPSEDGSEPPVIEQKDNQSINELGPVQEYEQPTESEDILKGNTSLQNVIDNTIPKDVLDDELKDILPDFVEQLEMGGTKCE